MCDVKALCLHALPHPLSFLLLVLFLIVLFSLERRLTFIDKILIQYCLTLSDYENTQFTLMLVYLICTKVSAKYFGLRTKANPCMCRRKALPILSKLCRLKEMLTESTLIITYTEYHEEH